MTKKDSKDLLWVEKYRPQKIKDVVLPKRLKTFFTKMINKKEITNLLLYSTSPGSGKSTISKAICNELGSDYLYINASNSGIDTLRNDIKKYAHVKSLTGSKKVVILDEADGMTPKLQEAFRADLEKYTSCRFIFTANYVTKLIDPLRSRLQEINFNMTDKKSIEEMKPKVLQRLQGILKAEKVEYDEEVLPKIIDIYFPDIRKMINLLHQYSLEFNVIDKSIFDYQQIDSDFYNNILKSQFTKARKYLIDNNVNYDEMFRTLYDNFIPMLSNDMQGQVILVISEYMYKSNFVIDKEINFSALLLEIMGILND